MGGGITSGEKAKVRGRERRPCEKLALDIYKFGVESGKMEKHRTLCLPLTHAIFVPKAINTVIQY